MDPCRDCRGLTLRPGRLPRQPVRRRPQPCGADADSDNWRSPSWAWGPGAPHRHPRPPRSTPAYRKGV